MGRAIDEEVLGFLGEAVIDVGLALDFAVEVVEVVERIAFLGDPAGAALEEGEVGCLVGERVLDRQLCQLQLHPSQLRLLHRLLQLPLQPPLLPTQALHLAFALVGGGLLGC